MAFKQRLEVDERASNGNINMAESSWQRNNGGKGPEA